MKNNKRRRKVEVDLPKLDGIIESARERSLGPEECAALRDALHAMAARLAPWKTEKIAEVLEALTAPGQDGERPKPRGHGRNGVEAFTGADRVPVPNQQLEAGCPCPECERGRVYLQKDPSSLIRFVGGPPLGATIYELERHRCNLCGQVFTAPPPPGVGSDKYDETAVSAVATAKYGAGIPFNRLEAIQQRHGVPLPASTQWDMVQEGAELLKAAQEELVQQAAQAAVLHADDTGMRVVTLPRQEKDARTGVHTSGVVAKSPGGQTIALFFTGPKHSGENIRDVLAQRAAAAGPAVLMSDGSSWPTSKLDPGLDILIANCLAHGRRNFVKIFDRFPEECRHVLEVLGRVYLVDEESRQGGLDPKVRLKLHKERSEPEMKALRHWISARLEENIIEPNSNLGKAMSYMLRHWNALTLFLRVEGAPLDNNICERALKKAVLHRKNALFYRTLNGAEVGDLFMSLIHTCELNQVNAFDYLTELQRHPVELKADPSAWMPWNYREQVKALPQG